jgi:hypothetical protein
MIVHFINFTLWTDLLLFMRDLSTRLQLNYICYKLPRIVCISHYSSSLLVFNGTRWAAHQLSSSTQVVGVAASPRIIVSICYLAAFTVSCRVRYLVKDAKINNFTLHLTGLRLLITTNMRVLSSPSLCAFASLRVTLDPTCATWPTFVSPHPVWGGTINGALDHLGMTLATWGAACGINGVLLLQYLNWCRAIRCHWTSSLSLLLRWATAVGTSIRIMEGPLQKSELRGWIKKERLLLWGRPPLSYWGWLLLVFDANFVLHYCRRLLVSHRSLSRCTLDLTTLNQYLCLLRFLVLRIILHLTWEANSSVWIRLWIIVKWCTSISLEVCNSRRSSIRTWIRMLMILFIWRWWKPRALLSAFNCGSCSNAWRTLARLRERLLFRDDLELSHWVKCRIYIRLVHSLWGLNKADNFTPPTSIVNDSMVDQGILVVQVHVWLATLRRLDCLTWPVYLVE